MKRTLSNKGFAHFVIPFVVAGVVVGSSLGILIIRRNQQNHQNQKTASSQQPQNPDESPLATDKTEAEKAPETTTQPPAVKTEPKTQAPAAPAPSNPAPAPAPDGIVGISADGCQVTAIGKKGMTVKIGSYSANKGGVHAYSFTADGEITKHTGGIYGMTGYGTLYDSSGKEIASASQPITVSNCPPAG